MKIAIAAEDNNLDALLSQAGGRAPYYLIFENGALAETYKNPFAVGGGGAAWSVAHILAEKGVNKVVLGKIGENMAQALHNVNIEYTVMEPRPINEILKDLKI